MNPVMPRTAGKVAKNVYIGHYHSHIIESCVTVDFDGQRLLTIGPVEAHCILHQARRSLGPRWWGFNHKAV